MMRSLYSGVSGLRTHQTRMDVIGDNIANVNTVGFKRSAVTFKDVFYQTLRGGSAGNSGGTGMGGTNPQQIGLGVTLGSIDVVHTQGAAASTGNGTDLMIQGDGFFVVKDSAGNLFYTRAGAFHFDNEGHLVTPDGMYVMQEDGSTEITVPTDAQSFSIDNMGVVHYSDGTTETIGLAKFLNPTGLEKVGQNLYRETASSGTAQIGKAGDSTKGLANTTIITSALEMSNVDLAQEFTDMIITERGFQANARTITTSDQMLQELVNLKR
ncbi:flagellar basal body rod protein [Moorella thermoacetica Y72]|uniref:Flagellar hook protein FlgE n=1 Tax=Moorella thermoacetica Y72 TaxID=1325331 RepID=A0A0S6UHM7_NEOTH|nr:flagellar hook-basal body complex protein [Moorella thermoacetica]GAF26491.1 flagellar basal body rod protein [Moorella thermoacetica Y72]